MNKFGNFKTRKIKGFKMIFTTTTISFLAEGKDEINDARCFMFNVSLPSSLYLN